MYLMREPAWTVLNYYKFINSSSKTNNVSVADVYVPISHQMNLQSGQQMGPLDSSFIQDNLEVQGLSGHGLPPDHPGQK